MKKVRKVGVCKRRKANDTGEKSKTRWMKMETEIKSSSICRRYENWMKLKKGRREGGREEK